MENPRVSTPRGVQTPDSVDANLDIWARELPDLDLETHRMQVAGVTLLREYAMFAAVPVSALGFVIGRVLGRCS